MHFSEYEKTSNIQDWDYTPGVVSAGWLTTPKEYTYGKIQLPLSS